ncbi:MAG: DNA polymerase IV [bacterium]
MNRVIMLVDMNAFFAQVEQKGNPSLRGKPVLVGGSPGTRTVVTAASYEARPYGIRAGVSYGEAMKMCPHAVLVEGNQEKYVDYSYRLAGIYREFTDLVEVYSIDEAFLDITNVHIFGLPETVAMKIKKRIMDELGLTCSIGIAPSKLVAKMAAEWEKPDGLVRVYPEELPEILWDLPVEEIVGVGSRMKRHLNSMGIYTIGHLAKCSPQRLERKFGVYGALLHQWANGIDDTPVDPESLATVKSVGHSYTLPSDTDDVETLRWFLFHLSDKVGRRLRKGNYRGRTITLVLRTENFITFTRAKTLPYHTNTGQEIHETAMELLMENFPRTKIRLVGVSVSNLISARRMQLSILDDLLAKERTMKAVDGIKDKYGEYSITFASLLSRKSRIRKKIGCFLTNMEKGNKESPLLKSGAD